MNINKIIFAAGLLAVSSLSTASLLDPPNYTGSTFGQDIFENATRSELRSFDPGFYIWNDESATRDWSIRWIGSGAPAGTVDGGPRRFVGWDGDIQFTLGGLDIDSIVPISFDGNGPLADDGYETSGFGGNNILSFDAFTNRSGGFDGLDFSLNTDTDFLEFYLGSSLAFSDYDVFIGSFDAPVETLDLNGYKRLDIEVPEPGVMGLFGLALAGLGLARRKSA